MTKVVGKGRTAVTDASRKRKTPFERRAEIVDVALQCFNKKGLRSTTMLDIARACGISVGHVYNFFDSKESVIEAVVALFLEDFFQKTAIPWADTKEHLSSYEDLRQDVRKELSQRLKRESLLLMLDLFAEGVRNERINSCLRAAGKKVRSHVSNQIKEECQERGKEPPKDLDTRICMSFALFDGMLLQHVANPSLRLDDMASIITTTLISLHEAESV